MRTLLLLAALPAASFAQVSPASIARGEKLFAQGCAVGYCHGAAGSAARSPRLRGRSFDKAYLIKVINEGIPNTAMPAWGDRLTDPEIDAIADYIQSLANASIEVPAAPGPEVVSAPASTITTVIPDEHKTGRDLFYDPSREARCSSCHRLNGFGTPIGPDVTKVNAIKATDGVQVLRYGRPRGVRTIVLTDGDRFPAQVVERTTAMTRAYDLSSAPPVLRTLAAAEIQSIQRQTQWRHMRAVREYSSEEMQAVWDFVRWMALGK